MDFFRRLSFLTFLKKDVIDEKFLDEQTSRVLDEFDGEYRFKEVNDLVLVNREIETNLLYAITVLWTHVVNASHNIYKKIQILEADYIDVKSQLDDKIEYELQNQELKRQGIKDEIKRVDEDLLEYNQQRKDIEAQYHKMGEAKVVRGSLNRLHWFWFLFVMVIAGAAELFIYKNVFLSQEIGLMADKQAQDKYLIDVMALSMATGFTVMIVWLSHKLGELLRHYDSAIKSEKWSYIGKIVFISLVVAAAIFATVKIRGDMHQILAKDQKVENLQERLEEKNPFSDVVQSEEEGFGDMTEDEEDEDDEGGFGEGEEEADESESVSIERSTKTEEETLRDEIVADKGATAWLFSIINIFIVVGGVFLSYETHTSSRIYETIEKHIKKLERLKERLEEELNTLDSKIVRFKKYEINHLFKELLLKAALYDKEVRTYNTYMQIFELKMQLIEDYIKKMYDEKGVSYTPISYLELLDNKINLDIREELHHVKNIDEYMIYKQHESKKFQEESVDA